MKKTSLALFLLSATAALAQDQEAAQPEMPSNLTFDTDFYIVEPKFTFSFGVRGLTGAKTSFHGTGFISSSQDVGPLEGNTAPRQYHDGSVGLDQRFMTIDNGDGTSTVVPISPDGQTNTWTFSNDSQIVGDTVQMHTYAANVLDTGPHAKNLGATFGVEAAVSRDMGKISTHFMWDVTAGMSSNDINAKLKSAERASITTLTDTYLLNGQPVPAAPYSSPSSTSDTVTNGDGTTTTTTTDTSILISNTPDSRTTSTTTTDGNVFNRYHLKGAFYTFRAGPTITLSVTDRLRASFSAGAVLVYAGSTLSVEQNFQPDLGVGITGTEETSRSAFLPGYYADANVEFWLTERAGFYAGAVYQSSGDYKQSLASSTAQYTAKVDLSSLQGFRMGMNIRF